MKEKVNTVRKNNQYLFESQYASNLVSIMKEGLESGDRTGTGTIKIQSCYHKISVQNDLPILVGKKMNFKLAFVEMIWIMLGRSDLKFLKDNGVNYWDSWVKEDGTFGPIYGKQMRHFGIGMENTFDQLVDVVNQLKNNPDSRRIIISLWNPNELKEMTLPCCHNYYQFCSYISDNKRYVDLHVTQRSADMFLGVPYDALLFTIMLRLVCMMTDLHVGNIHYTTNDTHIYQNHFEQVNDYIDNYVFDKLELFENRPELVINNLLIEQELNIIKSTSTITSEQINNLLNKIVETDFQLFTVPNYKSYPLIKAQVAV